MSNFIPGVLSRARNAFRRVGIQPPYWLIQLGRRLHGKYSRSAHPLASFAAPDRQNMGRLEAKVDHLLWTMERIEATLYLQSLQAKPPATGPAATDASQQP